MTATEFWSQLDRLDCEPGESVTVKQLGRSKACTCEGVVVRTGGHGAEAIKTFTVLRSNRTVVAAFDTTTNVLYVRDSYSATTWDHVYRFVAEHYVTCLVRLYVPKSPRQGMWEWYHRGPNKAYYVVQTDTLGKEGWKEIIDTDFEAWVPMF